MEGQTGRIPTATFGELPPDALLTADEVGEWLKVARRHVQSQACCQLHQGAGAWKIAAYAFAAKSCLNISRKLSGF